MPRSFLVKKHFSATKKPNYSELESQTVYISPFLYDKFSIPVIPQPEILGTGAYFPPLVWDTGLLTTFFTAEPDYSQSPISTSGSDDSKPLDLTSFSSEDDEGKTSDPPSPASSATEAEKFHCNQCSKSYSTFAGLSKHKQLHCDSQTRKSFSCKYCEKEYVSLGALKMHIRSHTLPCVCKICGKAFSRPWLLQGHIRTHTDPFRCEEVPVPDLLQDFLPYVPPSQARGIGLLREPLTASYFLYKRLLHEGLSQNVKCLVRVQRARPVGYL
ncbi:zinc finger protein SNAI1 isoform X1 [Ranitomeya variabilis]|uniref:zinc finger protein SNAI1 isoform X1 n=1 Tax=Ranitomeya variabilis TaxID=490064 RepID=UPI004057B515